MQPVRRGLVLLPQRGLRFVSIPDVLLSGDMAIEQRLVLKLVSAEAPRERVLSPDDLASDLESSGFQRVLKFALPGRAVAHVHRGAGLRDGSAGAKCRLQELSELG